MIYIFSFLLILVLSLSPIDSRLLILRLRSFKNGYDYGPKISRGIINHSSFPNYLENKNSHIGHENAYRKMSNDLEKVASGRRIRSNNHLLNYIRINYRYFTTVYKLSTNSYFLLSFRSCQGCRKRNHYFCREMLHC